MPSLESAAVIGGPPGLGVRLASAAVMATVAVALTLAGPWPFAVLVAAGAVVAAWEWGRLVRGRAFDTAFAAHAGALIAAGGLAAAGSPWMAAVVLVGGGLLVAWLSERRWWSVTGVAYIGLPVLSLVLLRSDPQHGVAAILYLFAVIWSADSAAYAFGRTIGGPKLAPRVSPNKTWAGFVGAIVAPAAASGVAAAWIGGTRPLALALVGAGLALVSQIGDLAESAAKRTFGIKDASALIPGHGGLLDRVDGLIFASVAAALLGLARDAANPGQALIVWP